MRRAGLAIAFLASTLLAVGGLHAEDPSSVRRVVVTGQAVPGGGTFDRFSVESLPVVAPINGKGHVAFLATVRRGRESLDAIYLHSGGKSRKVVAQGDPAPAGGAFTGFGPPALNGKGLVGFGAVVEGRAVPGGLFVSQGGAIRMLVGAGEETPDGGIFAKFSERVAVNDAGAVAFNAILKGAPTSGAIYVVDDRVRRIAGLGDPAPGGGVFSHFGLWPSLSATGAVVFAASVDGGASPVAVFAASRKAISRVAGVGDRLPGGGTP